MSFTRDVSFQCSSIDSAINMVAKTEEELGNVHAHMDNMEGKLMDLEHWTKSNDVADWEMDEIRNAVASLQNDITEMEVDYRDAVQGVAGHDELLEDIRGNIEQLRQVAEDLGEEGAEHEATADEHSDTIEERDERIAELEQQLAEQARIINPMIPIPFKTVDEGALEVWNKSLGGA